MAPHGQLKPASQGHAVHCRHDGFLHPSDIFHKDSAVPCRLGSGFIIPKGLGKPADVCARRKGPSPVSTQHKTFYCHITGVSLQYSYDLIYDLVTERIHGLRPSNRDDFYTVHLIEKKMSMKLLVVCNG